MMALVSAWIGGGALFLSGMARQARNEDTANCLAGVRRFDPAALVALAMFVAVWPAVFVAGHLGKRRSNG